MDHVILVGDIVGHGKITAFKCCFYVFLVLILFLIFDFFFFFYFFYDFGDLLVIFGFL